MSFPGGRWFAVALLLGVSGCRESGAPAPTLESVSPAFGPDDAVTKLTLKGKGFSVRVVTDFHTRSRSTIDARYEAKLRIASETVVLRDVARTDDTEVMATVPAGLSAGRYDVVLKDPYGQETVLEQGYQVRASRVPARLAFTTAAPTFDAGACSAAITVQVQDGLGGPAPVPAAVSINLSAAPPTGALFFSDAACASAITAIEVPAQLSSATFFFSSSRAGSFTLDVAALALAPASQTVTVRPLAATRLVFTQVPPSTAQGACSQRMDVQLQDALGNGVPVAAPLAITLAAVPAAGFAFYADAACSVSIPGVGLAVGQATASFYFRGAQPGVVDLEAQAPGYTAAAAQVTVLPGAPVQLGFATPAQTVTAGQCSPALSLETRDAAGTRAPVAVLTAVGLGVVPDAGVQLFTDASCLGAGVSAVGIVPGTSTASLRFRSTVAGQVAITASATGLSPATQQHTVTAAAAAAISFVTPARSVAANACSPVLTVELQDAFSNPSPAAAATMVGLSGAPPTGLTFYSDPGCGTGVTAVQVGAGATTADFYFRSSQQGTVMLTASSGTLTPGAQAEVVVSAITPVRVAFSTPPRTAAAGACAGPVTLEARSTSGAATMVAADTPVTLLAMPAAGFTVHTDGGCASSAVTSAVILAGTATVSVYVRGTAAGQVMVDATANGLLGDSQLETVTAGPAASFSWDPISNQVEGASFSASAQAKDSFGNLAVTFTDAGTLSIAPAGSIACSTSCSGPSATSAFAAGAWTGTLTVGAPSGPGRQLTLTAGSVTGTSNAFDVVAPAVGGSPPIARFTFGPAALVAGGMVSFDATTSSDFETAAAALEVSWDFTGQAAGPPPWSAWTTVKTATFAYPTDGTFNPLLAVRDGAGNVAYGTATLVVVPASALCTVTTAASTDDGATSCAGPLGTDGKLSLREAVRLANATAGVQTITFSGPMRLIAPNGAAGVLTFNDPAQLIAPSGVVLDKYRIETFGAATGSLLLAGLEATASPAAWKVKGKPMVIQDSYFHDTRGFAVDAPLTLTRVQVANCEATAAGCVELTSATARATVRGCEFKNTTAGMPTFRGGVCAPVALDIQSSVFIRAQKAIEAVCAGTMLISNNTFHASTAAITYAGGAGHVLQNNLFSSSSVTAASCGTASFATRDFHGLFQNASDGCLGADPGGLTSDPGYLLPPADDLRLASNSLARDSAFDAGVDLNGAAPGNFFGAGPDRGGLESW